MMLQFQLLGICNIVGIRPHVTGGLGWYYDPRSADTVTALFCNAYRQHHSEVQCGISLAQQRIESHKDRMKA